jgi:phosphomethylpyrimidine synthase
MRISQDVRDYAKKGMAEKSREFTDGGSEIYRKSAPGQPIKAAE